MKYTGTSVAGMKNPESKNKGINSDGAIVFAALTFGARAEMKYP